MKPRITGAVFRREKKKISHPKDKFSRTSFPIVGIGASADGLEAFEDFFAHMGSETGMAFVMVAHQRPGHTSALPKLIGKCTRMEVLTIKDGMPVRQNCVYLIPPGVNLSIFNQSLHLAEARGRRSSHLPIDFFFRSLADEQRDKAIGIILSGTGTDGTLGLRAIKGESGMVMVQEPKSARFPGMPQSAIDTGLADYILPSSKMPAKLLKYVRGPFLSAATAAIKRHAALKSSMQRIFIQLRQRTGHDFSCYKNSTVRRRIERRMNVHHIQNPMSYVRYMQENPRESELLFKELLIGVTRFFRDPESYEFLTETVFPKLLAAKPEGYKLRAWVAGCASGEEAYSLAIALRECMDRAGRHLECQIFATDLDSQSIDFARAGVYPEGIAVDIDPQRLKKYFLKEENSYHVRKDIREMVIFARQNLIKDPPFTKLDLVSCRNVLIYLEPDTQKKVMDVFHYALRPEGVLFLGSSETIGNQSPLRPASKRHRVFLWEKSADTFTGRAHAVAPESAHDLPEAKGGKTESPGLKAPPSGPGLDPAGMALVEHFVPPSLIVNDRGDIIYIHGRVSPFIEMPPGRPNHNALLMAKEGLKAGLASALRLCKKKDEPVKISDIPVRQNGGILLTDLTVQKITVPLEFKGLLLVSFQASKTRTTSLRKQDEAKSKKKRDEVETLKAELQYTRETLQSTIKELETTNEDLKSTNEELQSTNEELQSSNEEIETSKEELQSLNEELQTTNMELQTKIDELTCVHDDMKNLLNSTEIPTLFLDNDLNIKRFTGAAKKVFNLIASDVGRPLRDLTSNLVYPDLLADCQEVLRSLVFKAMEVQAVNKGWYVMRIMPYRTSNNVIDGLVLVFSDITALQEAKKKIAEECQRLAAIVEVSNDAVTMQDFSGNIHIWNKAARSIYGYSEEEALKMNISKIIPDECRNEMESFRNTLRQGSLVPSFTTKRLAQDGRLLRIALTATLLRDENEDPAYIITTERDLDREL